jgi:UDP-N-acetylglucosamine 4,6-dehydratase/5-epimerase
LATLLDDKNILVTGGTGSFGKRFIKTVLEQFKPRRLIVFSRDEYKQSTMQAQYNQRAMRFFLGDVRDRERLIRAMEGVDLVVHAAALKQVPALEYNPAEAIKTNVIGTENVVEAALTHNVDRVIVLSTDKAAAPVNLYGATKLTAEKIAISANNYAGKRQTRISVVRYGNVIGSRGSVIPLFQKLRDERAPELTITDPRMTRFLLTLHQSVQFVLDCSVRMWGGETFIPKIPSATIETVAEAVAPGMPRRTVGIRPGEKLHEVLCLPDTAHETLQFERHYVIKPSFKFGRVDVDYRKAADGEIGRPVAEDFGYNSRDNPEFMTPDSLRKMIDEAMPFE